MMERKPLILALIDTRGTPRVYASSCNAFFGMKVLRSTDLGKKFQETKSAPAFAMITALQSEGTRTPSGDETGDSSPSVQSASKSVSGYGRMNSVSMSA